WTRFDLDLTYRFRQPDHEMAILQKALFWFQSFRSSGSRFQAPLKRIEDGIMRVNEERGQWSVVSGQWSVVSGQWSVKSLRLRVSNSKFRVCSFLNDNLRSVLDCEH